METSGGGIAEVNGKFTLLGCSMTGVVGSSGTFISDTGSIIDKSPEQTARGGCEVPIPGRQNTTG
ncbi:unnamed protein product [Schistosoma curassoni]|uniref:Glu_synthase domain-containing protein n=1 Tax=Schistosoma curassoni TaxID=6186 RepID=A0A183JG94_9TREM|nr:unnamed protein product [Schistosoma curassoni]